MARDYGFSREKGRISKGGDNGRCKYHDPTDAVYRIVCEVERTMGRPIDFDSVRDELEKKVKR